MSAKVCGPFWVLIGCQTPITWLYLVVSQFCLYSPEIAYFNPNTKDVIPGVSPQVLQIKVKKENVTRKTVQQIPITL